METIHNILKKHWGFDSFRSGQEDIINQILESKDTLALMPTGGGKSITYQVPALAKDGICIVLSPLIALMKDQVARLNQLKIKALAIYSGMTYHEIEVTMDNALYGNFKFLYISPERLETDIFKSRLAQMNICLIAVDEAHCISQWGYDFRPSYLNIAAIRELHPDVPILALTATATNEVAKDIQDKLLFKSHNVIKSPFLRENLIYAVRDCEDKQGFIINTINKIKGSGIVYARNRKNTKELAQILQKNGINADFYHAGLRSETRHLKQQEWTSGKTRVICSTNAFGMGIDKPDVRFVIHNDVPDTIEEYYQEAGRAGRDKAKAYAVLLANKTDHVKIQKRISNKFPEIQQIKRIYNAVCNYYQIPIGSGKGNIYDFNLLDFCSVYKLSALIAFNSLKILEKEGYIELTDDLNNPSRIFFTINRDDLYRFQVSNAKLDAFIKLLLRSYTGLFNNYTPIDETALARRAKLKANDIYQYLIGLAKQKIINYIPQKKTPLLIFREERLDDKSLIISPSSLKERKQRFEHRINKMWEYASENTKCRNKIILDYFDEQAPESCGTCDNCRKEIEKGLSYHEFNKIKTIIVEQLEEKAMKAEDLQDCLPFDTNKKQAVLRHLIDNETISYDKEFNLVLKGKIL